MHLTARPLIVPSVRAGLRQKQRHCHDQVDVRAVSWPTRRSIRVISPGMDPLYAPAPVCAHRRSLSSLPPFPMPRRKNPPMHCSCVVRSLGVCCIAMIMATRLRAMAGADACESRALLMLCGGDVSVWCASLACVLVRTMQYVLVRGIVAVPDKTGFQRGSSPSGSRF